MRNLLLLALLAGTAGCALDAAAPDGEKPRRLSFHFAEFRTSIYDPPYRLLRVETADAEYPCANYQLHGTITRNGTDVEVATSGTVRVSDLCLTAIGPAILVQEVDLEPGEYRLVFRNAGRTDRYTLSVSDTLFRVQPVRQTFTHPRAARFPMTVTQPLPESLRTPDPECAAPARLAHVLHGWDGEYLIYLRAGVPAAPLAEFIAGLPGAVVRSHWTPSSGGAGYVNADMPPEHVPTIRCREEVLSVWRRLPQ